MVFEMAVMMHVDRCLLGEFVRSLRQEDTAGTDRKSSDITRQRLERDQRPVPRIVIGKRRELGLVGVRKFYFPQRDGQSGANRFDVRFLAGPSPVEDVQRIGGVGHSRSLTRRHELVGNVTEIGDRASLLDIDADRDIAADADQTQAATMTEIELNAVCIGKTGLAMRSCDEAE